MSNVARDFDRVVKGLENVLDSLLRLQDVTDNFDLDEEENGPDIDGLTYTEKIVDKTTDCLNNVYDALNDAKEAAIDFKTSEAPYSVFERTLELISANCSPIVSLQEMYANLKDTTAYVAGPKQAFLLVHERLKDVDIDLTEYNKKREILNIDPFGDLEEEGAEDAEQMEKEANMG